MTDDELAAKLVAPEDVPALLTVAGYVAREHDISLSQALERLAHMLKTVQITAARYWGEDGSVEYILADESHDERTNQKPVDIDA